MNNEKEVVVLGALLHNIGKFAGLAGVSFDYEGTDIPYKNLERPISEQNIRRFVSVSDRLAAGLSEDDEKKEARGEIERGTRLFPILEQVHLEGKEKKPLSHRMELKALSLDKETLFPKDEADLKPKEGELLTEQYRTLWDGFEKEFRLLPRGSLSVFTESLLYLLEKYTWCIPSSTMEKHPDISLFDHSRTTAAIAACLHDYHEHGRSMSQTAIENRDEEKFLLICGDVSGIQKFIYNITAKGAAKGLRGRSFLIQLFSEAAAKHILRELAYPSCNLLYSGGGRFYLLIAKQHESKLEAIRSEINKSLLEKHNAEIYLALGWCGLRGEDFEGNNFPAKWKESAQSTNEDKRRKFADLEYEEIFAPRGKGYEAKNCQVCKKEDDDLKSVWYDEEEVKRCQDCIIAEELGQKLSKAEYLVEVYKETGRPKQRGFDTPIPDTRYYLLDDLSEAENIEAEEVFVYRLNDTNFLSESRNTDSHILGFKFVGGARQGKNLMFDKLTEASTGLKRLGILRMDVDNLGQVFTKGLGDRASVSKVAGLSRQLSIFFGGYLNRICRKGDFQENTLIIYSGGDDLFVVGAWDKIIELAPKIREAFREFTCGNSSFSLSGGIAMATKKYAIYRSAEHAGEAEEKAKEFKREANGKKEEKDALTFLNKTLGWHDLEVCAGIKNSLHDGLTEGKNGEKLPAGILTRLREIYLLYAENKTYWEKQSLSREELEKKVRYNKWKWRAVYSLNRAFEKSPLFKDDIQNILTGILDDRFGGKDSEQPLVEFLDVPVRWAEFLIRKETRDET